MKNLKLNVLILEDDLFWSNLYKELFKKFKDLIQTYEIVDNLEDAKNILKNDSNFYDLLIFDYYLKDNKTSLDLLDESYIDPKKIVFVTGNSEDFINDVNNRTKNSYKINRNTKENFYKTIEKICKTFIESKKLTNSSLMKDKDFKNAVDDSQRVHLMMISKIDLLENCLRKELKNERI